MKKESHYFVHIFVLSLALLLAFAFSFGQLTTGMATAKKCGNGVINPGEQCDGTSLNGKTCQLIGYSGGTLKCTSSCNFDMFYCSNDR